MQNKSIAAPWMLAIVTAVLATTGCSKQSKWEGIYINSKDQTQLELLRTTRPS